MYCIYSMVRFLNIEVHYYYMSVNNKTNTNREGLEAILAEIGMKPEHFYLASILASIPTPALNYLAAKMENWGELSNNLGFYRVGKCLKDTARGLREYITVREESNKLDKPIVEFWYDLLETLKAFYKIRGIKDIEKIEENISKLSNYYNSNLKGKPEEFGKKAESSMDDLYRAISECPYVGRILWGIAELINPNYSRYKPYV